MENTNNPFHKLLEQYTFGVAGLFIEAATASTQTDLITFLHQIDAEGEPAGALEKALAGPDRQVEKTGKPVDQYSVDKQWLARLMQARSERYDQHIRFLQGVIRQTEAHLMQIERTAWQQSCRTRSIEWYRFLLQSFKNQLAAAQHTRQASTNHLRQWQR